MGASSDSSPRSDPDRPATAWEVPRYRSTAVYLHQAPPLAPGSVESNLREPFGFAVHGGAGESVRTGMIPIIYTMMIVGIVSLPGMMTGQILAGADPVEAVEYQILVLFMIAASTALGTLGAVLLGYRRLFDDAVRLRHRRISRRGE